MLLIYLISFALATILLEFFLRLRRHNWLQQFNGPSLTLPILGDTLQFAGHHSMVAAKFRSNFEKYGPTWRFWLMTKPTLITADINLVKELLSSSEHLDKHFTYDYSVKLFFGEGLLASDVHQWKKDRKVLNKIFDYKYLQSSFKTSLENSKTMVEKLLANQDKPMMFGRIFRDHIIATVLMSTNVEVKYITEDLLRNASANIDKALALINTRIKQPWMRNKLLWTLSGSQSRLRRIQTFLSDFVNEIIVALESGSQKQTKSSERVDDENCQLVKIRQSLQDLLVNPSISVKWKRDHFITLIAGGADTTTIAGTMTLFFLALNPDCQRKAQEEIDSAFISTEIFKTDDISKLKYLRMCLKEALRLHPPAPVIGRITSKEIDLENGRRIPRGAAVLVSIHEMNLNPNHFPDPFKFDPQRFDESSSIRRPTGSFIPFSFGPRNCIGMKYSECVLLAALSMTLKEFSVHTNQKADDIKILYEVAGTPFPDVEIIFKQRNNKHPK